MATLLGMLDETAYGGTLVDCLDARDLGKLALVSKRCGKLALEVAARRLKRRARNLGSSENAFKLLRFVQERDACTDPSGKKLIGSGHRHTVVLGKGCEVFGWGDGILGNLGRKGLKNETLQFATPLSDVTNIVERNAKQVVCGDGFTAMLTRNGRLFLMGRLLENNHKLVKAQHELLLEKEVCCFSHCGATEVTQIAAGSSCLLAILNSGEVFSIADYERFPKRIAGFGPGPEESIAVSVACGDSHLGIVSKEGHLYTAGFGGFGRLGHGDERSRLSPKRVESLVAMGERVVRVSAGFRHTAVVTESGKVFTFGCGTNGQLGLGNCSDSLVPRQVGGPLRHNKAVQVECGKSCTVVLTEYGRVFSFGVLKEASETDMLHLAQLFEIDQVSQNWELEPFFPCPLPKLETIENDTRIVQISCSYNHVTGLGENGKVFTLGVSRNGRLGQVSYDCITNMYCMKFRQVYFRISLLRRFKRLAVCALLFARDGCWFAWVFFKVYIAWVKFISTSVHLIFSDLR